MFAKIGTLVHWLDIHIYLGIFGPSLIVLHSTFKVNGLVAVSFYSMVAVALSGILGRYLYLQIPRNIQGHELSLNKLNDLDQKLTQLLKQRFAFTDPMIRQVEHLTASSHLESKSTLVFLFTLSTDGRKRRRAFNKFRRENPVVHKLAKHQVRAMLSLARQKAVLHQRIQVLNRVNQIFHYWHVIHKPFAFIMIIIMFVHITVAVMFGYKWVF
ncbi:hypothetical protein JW960_10115 [candidate division KSB1 bacterium]|nr:hypothetical protein [candidate division KSB1 bacterium]